MRTRIFLLNSLFCLICLVLLTTASAADNAQAQITKVFQEFFVALHKVPDAEVVRKSLSSDFLVKLNAAGFSDSSSVAAAIKELFPEQIEVVDTKIDGAKAVIKIVGVFRSIVPLGWKRKFGIMLPEFVSKRNGQVRMVDEKNGWRISGFGWTWP